MQCFDSTDSTNSTENTRLKQQHALNPQALSTCQAPWATSPASPRHLKNLPNTAHRDALSCSSDGQRQHCQGQRMDPQPCTYSQEIMLCNARLVDLPSLALLHPSHPKTSSLPALIPTEAHLPLHVVHGGYIHPYIYPPARGGAGYPHLGECTPHITKTTACLCLQGHSISPDPALGRF